MTYLELQNEIKRGAIRDQGGTAFDDGIKNIINRVIFRIGREAPFRSMRRKAYFETVSSYTTGSGNVTATNGSPNVNIAGATLYSDGIDINRKIKISGSGTYYTIREITSETDLVLDQNYSGTTSTTLTYSILPQEEYNLPIQAGHRMFMWHEAYGYPFMLTFVTDQDFYDSGVNTTDIAIPEFYRMWGADMVKEQVKTPSLISLSSTSASDAISAGNTINVTIFGTVSGYPDYETLQVNGITVVNTSKQFDSVERVVKDAVSIGRITVTANSGNAIISVLPVGYTTTGIQYKKIQLYPIPSGIFPINVQYYKDPYKLVNDGDVHELGEDFDQAIIFLAIGLLKYENNQDEGDKFIALYKDEMKTLRRVNMDKIDWYPKLRRPKDSRRQNKDLLVSKTLSYRQVGAYYGPRVGR